MGGGGGVFQARKSYKIKLKLLYLLINYRLNQIEKDLGLDFDEDEQADDPVQTSLSQKYTDLYENEWKQAMRKLTSVGEDRSVRVLLDAVKVIYMYRLSRSVS